MAERKRGPWLLATLVVLVLGALACCCGCAGLWHFFPQILIAAFTEDHPLDAPSVPSDPTVGERVIARFEAGGPVAVTPEELVQLVDPASEAQLDTFWVGVQPDDTMELVLSVRVSDQERWFNAHCIGAFELDHGWFTHVTVGTFLIGGWDLGRYMAGQELAQQANQSMANQRAQDPQVGAMLDQVERVWIEDGAVHVQLVEGGLERLRALRP